MKHIYTAFALLISATAIGQIQQDVNKTSGTVSKSLSQIDSIRFNTNTNQMEIIQTNGNVENHAISDIVNVTFSNELIGTINILNCDSAINNGKLFAGVAASGVSSLVPYSGGNGGKYNAQIATSTGVTGLTANLAAGIFLNGTGNLMYTISGVPSEIGMAIFAINIGGQSCNLTLTVDSGGIGPIVYCTDTPTAIVDVVNPITGKIWMDRNLGASRVATSITDTLAFGDLYQWGRRSDGHQCRNSDTTSILSSTDLASHGSFIISPDSLDWRSPRNDNLWQGVNGINNPCPSGYRLPTNIELNEERTSWATNNAAGAFDSPLKLTIAADRTFYDGEIGFFLGTGRYWSSTIVGKSSYHLFIGANNALVTDFLRAFGSTVRCIKDGITPPSTGAIGSLDCNAAVATGTLIAGTIASGASIEVPYTGGNGGTHYGQIVNSTGIPGLRANLTADTFAIGSGTITYMITGIPQSSGITTFTLNIGGKTCSINLSVDTGGASANYLPGTFFCNGTPTAVVDILNPTTGKTWMDRNLGASRVAISSSDASSYGDLYQWGRGADGHQCRNSSTTTTLSSTNQPGHRDFIISQLSNSDWRNPRNDNLWQGVNGINNPCPIGYRIPTQAELNTERLSWSTNNAAGAFASPLKFTRGGARDVSIDTLYSVGTYGFYWSSTISIPLTQYLNFYSALAGMTTGNRGRGFSVRCIKD